MAESVTALDEAVLLDTEVTPLFSWWIPRWKGKWRRCGAVCISAYPIVVSWFGQHFKSVHGLS